MCLREHFDPTILRQGSATTCSVTASSITVLRCFGGLSNRELSDQLSNHMLSNRKLSDRWGSRWPVRKGICTEQTCCCHGGTDFNELTKVGYFKIGRNL